MEGIDQAVIYKMLDARIGVFLVSVYRTMSLWMWLSYDKNYFLGMLLTALTQLYIPWFMVFQIDGNVFEGDVQELIDRISFITIWWAMSKTVTM